MTKPPSPPPRWLSFDCYGTLIDWQSGVTEVIRGAIPQTEDISDTDLFAAWEQIQWGMLHEPYARYEEILQESFTRTMEEFGFQCPRYAAEAIVDSVARWEPFPDVNPALIHLSRRYKLAVISNIDRALLGGSLKRLAVRFDMLITAEDAQSYKPQRAIFELALKKLACPPQEIVHVAFGAAYDLAPANHLGMRTVYLNRQGLPRPEIPIEEEITSLDELVTLWPPPPTGRTAANSGRTRL